MYVSVWKGWAAPLAEFPYLAFDKRPECAAETARAAVVGEIAHHPTASQGLSAGGPPR